MSDTLTNALQQSSRSSGVLDGIAHPATINPLAGMGTAMEMVGRMQGLDKNQAIKAWGEVLQQATDPKTGVVDYPRARALAAARGDTAFGMQEGLKDAQSLQTGAYNLSHAQLGSMHSGGAALLAQYPNGVPKEAIDQFLDNQIAEGMPAHLVNAARGTYGANPAQNSKIIAQGLASNMDAQTALSGARPHMGTVETGQGLQPYTQGQAPLSGAPPSAAVTPIGAPITTNLPSWSSLLGSVGQEATPEQAAALGVAPGTKIDVPLLQRDHDQGLDRVVPGIGGQGGGQRGTGGAAPAPAGAPAPGSYFPPTTPGVQPGRNAPPEGSPLRRNPATAGGTTTPGTSTTVTPTTSTSPPPPEPGGTGLKPIVVGTQPGTSEDVTQWQAANTAVPDQKRNIAAGEAALEALQYAHAGPGTAAIAKAKAFMVAQGIPGAGFIDSNDIMQRQLAQKNLLRFAQNSGSKVGTDLGLTTQLESNPNMDTMLNSTNDHILKQDLGLAKQRVAQTLTAPDRGTGKSDFGTGMGEHVQNFTTKTDPVAFAWDKLTPTERQAHLEQIKKVQGGMEKWERSMRIARDTGLIQVPTAAPAPAATAPAPAVVVRPQAPAQPPPNALQPTTGY